jgi:hypothetical protein
MKEKQKPQRAQRKTLCSQKDFPVKDDEIVKWTETPSSLMGEGRGNKTFYEAIKELVC